MLYLHTHVRMYNTINFFQFQSGVGLDTFPLHLLSILP